MAEQLNKFAEKCPEYDDMTYEQLNYQVKILNERSKFLDDQFEQLKKYEGNYVKNFLIEPSDIKSRLRHVKERMRRVQGRRKLVEVAGGAEAKFIIRMSIFRETFTSTLLLTIPRLLTAGYTYGKEYYTGLLIYSLKD